jgi:hypothetical protein
MLSSQNHAGTHTARAMINHAPTKERFVATWFVRIDLLQFGHGFAFPVVLCDRDMDCASMLFVGFLKTRAHTCFRLVPRYTLNSTAHSRLHLHTCTQRNRLVYFGLNAPIDVPIGWIGRIGTDGELVLFNCTGKISIFKERIAGILVCFRVGWHFCCEDVR